MKLLRRMLRKETGQVLPMALILLLLGAAVIIPTLSFTTTNLKATQSVDQHTREFYAADAGIDNALWYLQSDDRLDIINAGRVWPKTYWLSDYQPAEKVNNKDVRVNIETAWLLGGLPDTTIPTQQPSPNASYTLIGAIDIDHNTAQQRTYITDISTKGTGTELLDHIGIWMPQGYSYKNGTVEINGIPIGGPGTNYSLVQNPAPAQSWRSGNVYKWSYLGTTFKSLSDIAPLPGGGQPPAAKFPPSVRLSFDYYYNGAPSKEAQLFFPWIQLANTNMAWDTAAGFYHVQSTSFTSGITDNATAEAYVPRGVTRYLSGNSGAATAIAGDYIAVGNSLMTCCWDSTKKIPPVPPTGCNSSACTTCCGDNPYRNYAPAPVIFTSAAGYTDGERESYATVNSSGADAVPSDAKIERAYLYWTAWLRGDKVCQEQGHSWLSQWTQWMGADATWEANAPQEVRDWLKTHAYDGKAYLAVNDQKVTQINAGDPLGTVVADTWYISEGSNNVQPSYQYACMADVTAQVTAKTTVLRGAKFTVAGVHAHPATPATGGICDTASPTADWSRSANAGWSMVIIYSSAQKTTHQVYFYTGCDHLYMSSHAFPITGFAAPSVQDLQGGTNEAKMTVFASEGDITVAESLQFQGQNTGYYLLNDVASGTTGGVFNSISSAGGFTASQISTCSTAGQISGIDIDTYTATSPTGGIDLSTIVHPLDTSANILATSTGDGFEVIYLVFSVRSTAIPAGQVFNVGSMLFRIQ